MTDTFATSADCAVWLAGVKSRIRSAQISAYSQPEFLQQAVAELNRQSSVPSVDDKWQQVVAKLNRPGVLEFLEQSAPELRGKLPTSRHLSQALRLPVKRRGR